MAGGDGRPRGHRPRHRGRGDQFGRDAIPARPFLGLWPEERGEIEEDAREWLLRGAAAAPNAFAGVA